MNTLDLIKSVREVKEFIPRFIEWDKISKLIDAGRHAPSSGNIQNWKFVVVLDDGLKRQIAEASLQQYEIINAFVHIVVCAEPEKAERYFGIRGERLYSIQNCAAATQNIIIEAHSLGLGTRWIRAFDEEMIKDLLRLTDDIRPQAIIAVGTPKFKQSKPPILPLESQFYFNVWRNRIRDPERYLRDFALVVKRKARKAKDFLRKTTHGVVEKAKEKIKKE